MNLNEHNIQSALQQLARKMGSKNSTILLDRLGRNKQFINAIENPSGREIMTLIANTISDEIDKLMTPGMSEQDWNAHYKDYLQLQATLKFYNKVLNIYNTYAKDSETFKKEIGD